LEQSTALQSKKPATHTALPGFIAVVLVLCFAGLVVISDHFWLPWMKQVFPTVVFF